MIKLKKVISIILSLFLISSLNFVVAKRHAVRTHRRHYKSGKVVQVKSHTRTTKNK